MAEMYYDSILAPYYCKCLKWSNTVDIKLSPPSTITAQKVVGWPNFLACKWCGGTGLLATPWPEFNHEVRIKIEINYYD